MTPRKATRLHRLESIGGGTPEKAKKEAVDKKTVQKEINKLFAKDVKCAENWADFAAEFKGKVTFEEMAKWLKAHGSPRGQTKDDCITNIFAVVTDFVQTDADAKIDTP